MDYNRTPMKGNIMFESSDQNSSETITVEIPNKTPIIAYIAVACAVASSTVLLVERLSRTANGGHDLSI